MSIPLIIFIVALVLVVVFYKDARAFVYFVVLIDIFLRLVTYLKLNIIKDTAFSFLSAIPADVPDIIKSFDIDVVVEILLFIYVVTYIVFEVLLVRIFVKKKFK